MKKTLILSALAVTLAISSGLVMADDKDIAKDPLDKQQVHGRQLMTQQEREAFRTNMRTADSAEERQQIQKEHHERMKLRAKERRVNLPAFPPAQENGLKAQQQDRVHGRQLMTQQEREVFRNKMRSAISAEERQQIKNEHHERMKSRAKESGLSIPDNPPADGMGRGMGSGGGGR